MAEFPLSLEYAITSLVNTLVYKVMTRAGDTDALEEFVQVTGIPYVSDSTVRDYATQKAKEIWGPYMELPVPSSLDPAIEALSGAHGRLTNTGVTSIEDAEAFSLDALIPDFMTDFSVNQAGWRGATIEAVRSGYLDRWGGMVFLQANTIALLWLVLRGYQEQLRQAQNDVVKLVNFAEEVIEAFDPSSMCGSSESKNLTFNIAIGVLGVLSAGAGVAGMGVTSIVAAVGGAVLGVAKDAYEPDAPRESDIEGDSVAAIWQSVLTATDRLRQQFEASERELHDIIESFHNGVVNGSIRLGKTDRGTKVTIPALEAFRSKPLGPGTTRVERPYAGSASPDPAHSPEY
jgi:hypothetical protein